MTVKLIQLIPQIIMIRLMTFLLLPMRRRSTPPLSLTSRPCPANKYFLAKLLTAQSSLMTRRSMTALYLPTLRVGQIRTRAVLPQHETFYISLRLSFEPTVLVSINVRSGCHTRTSTFPPSSRSHVPHKPHTVTMFGREIAVTFTAMSYEWSWGDGTPNLVTTSTGSVWQDGMDLNTDPNLIRHYYTPPQGWRSMLDGPYPHEDREITLTTTWSGTLTNPFNGETQTINGLVTTTETTGKFPLSHLIINNTDTWEEKQGH